MYVCIYIYKRYYIYILQNQSLHQSVTFFELLFFLIGGLLFGIFGKRTNRFGREPIVLLGMISHWVCFLLILFNLPDTSPLPPVPGEQSTKDNILSVFHPPR